MVSTCLTGRSLLCACSGKTERKRGGKISTCNTSRTHHCVMSCGVTLHHPLSCYVQAMLCTIPCPNVGLEHSGAPPWICGTIYNPSLQIFTQRDKSTCTSQEQSPSVELSFPEPYTAMTRESQRLEPSESRVGGGGGDRTESESERKKKVRRMRMIGQSDIRILKKWIVRNSGK